MTEGRAEKIRKARADLAQAKRGKWRGLKENQAGKGDRARPVDAKKYRENYDAIFRKSR